MKPMNPIARAIAAAIATAPAAERDAVRVAIEEYARAFPRSLAELSRAVARRAGVSFEVAQAIVAALEDCEDGIDVD